VESILLLLGASANLLCHSVSLAIGNKGAYSTLSRSPHPAAPIPPQDDLVAALSAVLVLATHLISGGPWWQEAKAHHPLVLIETLSLTAKVGCSLGGVGAAPLGVLGQLPWKKHKVTPQRAH
jgi:hypothetical protein